MGMPQPAEQQKKRSRIRSICYKFFPSLPWKREFEVRSPSYLAGGGVGELTRHLAFKHLIVSGIQTPLQLGSTSCKASSGISKTSCGGLAGKRWDLISGESASSQPASSQLARAGCLLDPQLGNWVARCQLFAWPQN